MLDGKKLLGIPRGPILSRRYFLPLQAPTFVTMVTRYSQNLIAA